MAIHPTPRRSGRARVGALTVALGIAAGTVAATQPASADSGLTAPVITSAVFPPDTGSGPFPVVRTPGTFTFSEPAGSGVVEYAYVLNGMLSVPPDSNPHIAAGPDGTATTPPLRSAQWGTNTLSVVAVDAAGNEAESQYTFFLTPGPQEGYSDYDGDGHIDLMSIAADGTLDFNAGQGDGGVAAPVDAAPGSGYAGALIAGGGNENRGFFQNLFIFRNDYLYLDLGDGLGGFPTTRQVLVMPPSGLSAWPQFTQLVAPGNITGHNRADLIGRVGDQLLLLPSVFLGRYAAPVPIAGGGWSGRTVIGVVDENGDGIPDLVARDDAGGDVWLYPGTGGGNFGDGSTRVLLGTGLKASNYPLVVAKGDVDGDGLPDLWAVRKNGDLAVLPGLPGGGFGDPVNVDTSRSWTGVTALG